MSCTTWSTSIFSRRPHFFSSPQYRHASSIRRQFSSDKTLSSGPNANLPQQVDLLERYRSLVALGRVQYDEEQVRVIMKLRRLQRDLSEYTPVGFSNLSHWLRPLKDGTPDQAKQQDSSPWWSLSHRNSTDEIDDSSALTTRAEELASLDSPKGLLLTGPPGSGKTFLVDLWFSALPTPFKARKHYNELVLEIYHAVWEITRERMSDVSSQSQARWTTSADWKRRSLAMLGHLVPGSVSNSSSYAQKYANPPMAYEVARRLVHRHWLLVFDEIQLLDVSSASLLAEVLSWFWRLGGIVVGTSNKVPEDLYKNGVQRDRLEPFVEALKARCPVISLEPKDAERDWRVVRAENGAEDGVRGTWFLSGEAGFDDAVSALIAQDRPRETFLSVFGRPLHVPWTAGRTCQFSFHQLCAEELGSADYLTLASTFDTLILDNVPILKLSAKDQARRFISLIDALYEVRCRLVVRAEVLPADIFFPDATEGTLSDRDIMMAESVAETGDTYRPNVSSYDAPNMEEAPVERVLPLDTLSIFSGKDEQFAFKRALSRLLEMTSPGYNREEVWIPLPASSRSWESSLEGHGSTPRVKQSTSSPKLKSQERQHQDDDFAVEAAYEARNLPREARPAPRLREHHVWGVREDWGEGSGRWGKGAKAYEAPSSKPRP